MYYNKGCKKVMQANTHPIRSTQVQVDQVKN